MEDSETPKTEPRNPEASAFLAACGKYLKHYREKVVGLTQRQAAAKAGIAGQNGVSRAEAGVSLGHQISLARALGLRYSDVARAAEDAAEAADGTAA